VVFASSEANTVQGHTRILRNLDQSRRGANLPIRHKYCQEKCNFLFGIHLLTEVGIRWSENLTSFIDFLCGFISLRAEILSGAWDRIRNRFQFGTFV
jgi:hypothetical protein